MIGIQKITYERKLSCYAILSTDEEEILSTNESENTGIGHGEKNFAFRTERQAGCILILSSAVLTFLT